MAGIIGDISSESTADMGGGDNSGNVYNVGGWPVPDFPNFSNSGITAKVSMGSGTSYGIAAAVGLVVVAFLVYKVKKGK